jgi:hypothetical protein
LTIIRIRLANTASTSHWTEIYFPENKHAP